MAKLHDVPRALVANISWCRTPLQNNGDPIQKVLRSETLLFSRRTCQIENFLPTWENSNVTKTANLSELKRNQIALITFFIICIT